MIAVSFIISHLKVFVEKCRHIIKINLSNKNHFKRGTLAIKGSNCNINFCERQMKNARQLEEFSCGSRGRGEASGRI